MYLLTFFYFFINFGHYRSLLQSKGITNSTALSEAALNEANVAMLPGVDFGRQPEELVFRIAYVSFDGEQALNAVRDHYENKELDLEFITQYAPKMIGAMDSLENWLK